MFIILKFCTQNVKMTLFTLMLVRYSVFQSFITAAKHLRVYAKAQKPSRDESKLIFSFCRLLKTGN